VSKLDSRLDSPSGQRRSGLLSMAIFDKAAELIDRFLERLGEANEMHCSK